MEKGGQVKQLLAISILVFIFVGNAYAPDEQELKIYVNVSANEDDQIEKDIIESHIKRELRALGNIDIVDEKDYWLFRIEISALGNTLNGDKLPMMSIANSVHVRVPSPFLTPDAFKSNDSLTSMWVPVYSTGPDVSYWGRDDLPKWCVSKANSFDKFIKFAVKRMIEDLTQGSRGKQVIKCSKTSKP